MIWSHQKEKNFKDTENLYCEFSDYYLDGSIRLFLNASMIFHKQNYYSANFMLRF